MGLKDAEILEEIGDLYSKNQDSISLAIEAYGALSESHPDHGEAWQKLGDSLCSRQPLFAAGERDRAIEAYKKAVVMVDGDGNKQKIALTL